MRTAALYLRGRVVIGRSHLEAFQKLSDAEKNEYMVSGFYEEATGEFCADMCRDHFYNKKIVLIRHGQCQYDQCQIDPALNAQGISETEEVTDYLGHFDLTDYKCFTSPMLRCLQTTEIIQKKLGIQFEVKQNLMETPTFLNQEETFELKSRRSEFPKFRWPEEESWELRSENEATFMQRVASILRSLPSKSILISHFGVVTHMAKFALCDEKVMKAKVPTASLTFIDNQEVKCFGCLAK